jgi:uncharacterized membrane protein
MNVHPKVVSAGVAGALVTVIVAIAGGMAVSIDATVSAALTTLVMFGAGWLKSGPDTPAA